MIGEYTLSKEELKKECHSKIMILDELIDCAKKKNVGSKEREEYASLIAVILRALTCKTSGTDGLVKQCEYNKQLLFPLYNSLEAMNLICSYQLVFSIINNNQTSVVVRDDLTCLDRVYMTYLTFNAWLLEAVVDFKDQDFPPLSRYEIIRLIADKRGAHFQPQIDGRLYKITHEPILPIISEDGYNSDNLFTETIIGIAEELSFSYRFSLDANPQKIDNQDYIYIQKFNNKPVNSYKYVRSKHRINAYNSNNYFECDVNESVGNIYEISFRNRYFKVAIIDIE